MLLLSKGREQDVGRAARYLSLGQGASNCINEMQDIEKRSANVPVTSGPKVGTRKRVLKLTGLRRNGEALSA